MTTSIAAESAEGDTEITGGLAVCSDQSPDALLTAAHIWQRWNVAPRELERARTNSRGPRYFRIGSNVVYLRADVEEWCAKVGIGPRKIPTRATGPIECAPWCRDGDGHPNALFREDQRCGTEELRVDLTEHTRLEDAVWSGEEDQWVSGPDYVNVHAERVPDRQTVITLSLRDEEDTRLTVAEAHQLVEAMQLVLGQVAG